MIDLHLHSTNSDGSETPEELVIGGRRAGLTAMALTDHDNMGGIAEFLAACRTQGMTGIAGVEISAAVEEGHGTLHILGYGADPEHPLMKENLGRVLDGRAWRNEQILARLNELGLELDWSEVQACAGEDVVGRAHIAQALIGRDYVSSVAEAFDRYLAKGCPAYVDRYRLYPEEGLRMIREAGGVAVIAHPFTWETDETRLEAGLRELKAQGLAGVEAVYSEYKAEQTITLLRLAKRLGLLTTGGSDYHGLAKPDIALGRGFGTLCVPDEYLTPLLRALGENNPWVYVKNG
jgi:predicted metal-dependent phosphoesterase TrpH